MGRKPRRWFRQFGNNQYFTKAAKLARQRYGARWISAVARGAGLAGAIGVAGLANFFADVPYLDTDMRLIGNKRGRSGAPKAKSMNDPGSYAQLRYDRTKAGRKRSKKSKLSRLINSHMYPFIERFQFVTNLTSGAGAYYLDWDTTPTNSNNLPVYFFDLTGVINRFGDGTTTYTPCPLTRLQRWKAASAGNTLQGAYYTAVQNGKTQAGADAAMWQVEREPGLITSRAAERALLEWADIRLVLYGARKCPSWVTVMVVQFQEEDQVPSGFAHNGTTIVELEKESGKLFDATDPKYNRWQTNWQGFVDNLTGNPINVRDLAEQGLKLRVKYTKTYKFNPTSTTESDVTGHQVAVKLRYDINKVCTYVEDPRAHTEVAAADENNPNINPEFDAHMYSPFCAPKGREFILIKGYAGRVTGAADDAANGIQASATRYDYAPSFDFLVRRKRTHMRN